MPNISSLTMPDGIVYSIKDSQARKDVEEIKKQMSSGGGAASSVLDDLIEGKFGVHLVSNAESVADGALACIGQRTGAPFIGLGEFLESVDFPNATSIGKEAFKTCSALTSVDLPNVTSIGINAFYGISPTAVINIGAAEGEIEGAPWGAPEGVTINYGIK